MQRRRAGAVNRAHVGAPLEQVRDAGAARRGDVERRAAPRVPRVHVTFARVVVAERPRVRRAPEAGVPPGSGSSEAGATRKEARAEREEPRAAVRRHQHNAGLAPPPHGKCAGRRVRWWCHIDRAASVDTHDSALAAVLGLDDERHRAASSQETRARVDEPGAREPANKALALPEPLDPARKGDVVMRYRVCCLACVQRTHR